MTWADIGFWISGFLMGVGVTLIVLDYVERRGRR